MGINERGLSFGIYERGVNFFIHGNFLVDLSNVYCSLISNKVINPDEMRFRANVMICVIIFCSHNMLVISTFSAVYVSSISKWLFF